MSESIQVSSNAREEMGLIWGLAWPVVLGLLGHMATSVVDIVMVGRVGKSALASVALAHMWCHSLVLLGRGILQGVDPIITQAHGAGDRRRVGIAFQETFAVALLFSIPLVGWHFIAAPGLTLLHQPAERIPDADVFAKVLALGVVPMLVFNGLRQCVQGIEIMRPAAYTYLAMNILNLFLNYALIYGHWGFPALGAVGCAWSTSICQFFQLALMVWLVRKPIKEYWVSPAIAWTQSGILRLLRIGIPVGFQIGFEVWAFVFAGVIVGWLGETALAAHTVSLNLASVSFMMALGVSQASTTRVGNLIGAGHAWGRSAWCALALGCMFMSVSALIFAFFPQALAELYTHDADVVAIACLLIPIAASFQLFDGVQNVAFGILRGAGDVRVPVLITGFGLWLCGLPIGGFLAFERNYGPQGVWMGLVIGLVLMSALLVWRVKFLIRRGVVPTLNL